MITLKNMTDKKPRHKNWKSYCSSPCANCNSLFYVKTAQRFCYEDKYDLTQVKKQIIYKRDNKVNVIATGVIEHKMQLGSAMFDDSESILDPFAQYEKNLKKAIPTRVDYRTYALEETCKSFNISPKKFMRKLKSVNNELKEDQDEIS